MKHFLKGAATALITPFRDGKVNFDELGKLIEFQIAGGIDALVILGTTGEPSTLTFEEEEEIIRYSVKKIARRVKVIIGTGSNSTDTAIFCAKKAEKLGADGILAVTPYYNKCTQKGLIAYYEAIASSVSIPVICYNVPGRTGVNIQPATMAEIAKLPNIAGIKEASGNMAQVMETARLIRGKCELYSGEDALNLPILCAGGTAVISVVSNLLPDAVKELTELVFHGDLEGANALSDRLLPVADACFTEVNPIPVKAGAQLLGFEVGEPRSPLTPCEEKNVEIMRAALTEFGVKL